MKKIRVVLEVALRHKDLKDAGVKPEQIPGNFIVQDHDSIDGIVLTRDVINGYYADEAFFLDAEESYVISSEIIEEE